MNSTCYETFLPFLSSDLTLKLWNCVSQRVWSLHFDWDVRGPFCDPSLWLWVCHQVSFIVAQHEVIRNTLQEVAVVELGCVFSPHLPKMSKYLFDDDGKFLFCVWTGSLKGLCTYHSSSTSCFWSAVYPAFHCNQISSFLPLLSQVCSQQLLFRLCYKIGLAICSQKASCHLLAYWSFSVLGFFDHLTIQHLTIQRSWIFFGNSFSQMFENLSNLLCYIAIARGVKIKAKKCRSGLKVTRLFHWFVAQILMVWWQRLCSHSGSPLRIVKKHWGKELEGSYRGAWKNTQGLCE